MPIPGVEQPEIIQISRDLRLRKFDDVYGFAFAWYQDPDTVYLVDGNSEPYTMGKVGGMYHFLDKRGELYFIEAAEPEGWKPIGDVTFWKDDLPIVIGDPAYRGRQIGRGVIGALIGRGRELGYTQLYVDEIYDYNTGSRKCFESMGFRAYEKTEKGSRFVLELKNA